MRNAFAQRFGRPCEVVARAPGRVNLIGEHIDYNDGFVLPVALPQATLIAAAASPDERACVFSENLAAQTAWTLDEWSADRHPRWSAYVAGVASLLRGRGARLRGFDLLIRSDVPVGAGLSSSAALEIATALALCCLCGEAMDSNGLIDLCREAEHQFAGVPCGLMDQTVSLLAKADSALLLDCRTRAVEHIPLRLDDHALLVIDSGVRHELADGTYAQRKAECEQAATYFRRIQPQVRSLRDVSVQTVRAQALQMDPLLAARSLHVASENARVLAVADALRRGKLEEIGPLLSESHRSLREDYEVSSPELDRIVAIVSAVPGVLGARMTGGGLGGSVVALARRSAAPVVHQTLRERYDSQAPQPCRVLDVRPGPGASLVA